MTSKYDPYKNTMAERVNGILKSEFAAGEVFINQHKARNVINESIQIYHVLISHPACHYRSPKQAHEHPDFKPIKWTNRFSKHKISTVKNNFISLKQINYNCQLKSGIDSEKAYSIFDNFKTKIKT